MDFSVLVTIILSIAGVAIIVSTIKSRIHNASRGGAQPLTGAGPKPRAKSSNVRASRKVRK